MECLAKIYLQLCKCILYFLPRFDDDITICGRSDDKCVKNVTDQIQSRINGAYQCNCLPGCFEISYDAEVSMAPLLQNVPILQKRKLLEPNVSVVHIFYKNNYYRSQKKEELIGFTEFLCKNASAMQREMKSSNCCSHCYYFSQYRWFAWSIYGFQCIFNCRSVLFPNSSAIR